MAGDIEEFLRRAAQRQGVPSPVPPARQPVHPPPEVQILGDDDVIDADIVDAYPVEDPGNLSRQDVGGHMTRHLDTSGFGERSSHLGEEIDRADDRMETHLHDYFEHKLGDLGAPTGRASDSLLDDDNETQKRAAQPAKPRPFNIRELLHSPASIRDAIVLSEILRKPDERW